MYRKNCPPLSCVRFRDRQVWVNDTFVPVQLCSSRSIYRKENLSFACQFRSNLTLKMLQMAILRVKNLLTSYGLGWKNDQDHYILHGTIYIFGVCQVQMTSNNNVWKADTAVITFRCINCWKCINLTFRGVSWGSPFRKTCATKPLISLFMPSTWECTQSISQGVCT